MRLPWAMFAMLIGCGFEHGSSDTRAPDAVVTGDGSVVADTAIGGDHVWMAVEMITVPVDGTQRVSEMVLESGGAYRLRASGTFMIQATGTQGDAEWWDFANLMDGVTGVDVGLAVNDTVVDTMRTPKWGAYTPTHVYEVDWTGDGQRLVVMLHDGNFTNNSGSLTLTILQ